nr:hypothetical protein [Acidimicrobiia bacterium]
MFGTRKTSRFRIAFKTAVVLACLALVLSACGDDEDSAAPEAGTETTAPATTVAPEEMGEEVLVMEHLGDGSLGTVEVEPGEAVQIRSLNAITGDVAFFGLPIERSVVL